MDVVYQELGLQTVTLIQDPTVENGLGFTGGFTVIMKDTPNDAVGGTVTQDHHLTARRETEQFIHTGASRNDHQRIEIPDMRINALVVKGRDRNQWIDSLAQVSATCSGRWRSQ